MFDITQQNRLTADPDPANLGKLLFETAEARVRGIEVEAKTEIKPGFNLIASYAHLDHEVTKGATAAEVEQRLAQVPLDQASLWALYEFQEGQLNGVRFWRWRPLRWQDLGSDKYATSRRITRCSMPVLQYDFGKLNPQLAGHDAIHQCAQPVR